MLKIIINSLIFSALLVTNALSETELKQPPQTHRIDFKLEEAKAQAEADARRILLKGMVLMPSGLPVMNASLTADNQKVSTNSNGVFEFKDIPIKNTLITIHAVGYMKTLRVIHIGSRNQAPERVLPPFYLTPKNQWDTRLLFTGDMALGRRFLDPEEITPPDEVPSDDPNALIKASDPLPGSKKVLQYIKPLFETADFVSVNLETPVTDAPLSPHPTKGYVFFTLPDSLPALLWAGVDYAAIGNNHLYDYLEDGIFDTIYHLDRVNLPYSGAGKDSASAFLPYRTTINRSSFSFLSMTSVAGSQHSITYVATDTKGGAADLRSSYKVREVIEKETMEGYFPIVQVHTGKEYTFSPSQYAQSRFNLADSAGAALIIGHHPHVAQGAEILNSGTIAIHSLGNFAFDQQRLETMLGLIAQVDWKENKVGGLQFTPIYLEDYRPRMISGDLANRLIRRISENSPLNTLIYPYASKGRLVLQGESFNINRSEHTITIDVPTSGKTIIDLRRWAQSDASLSAIKSTSKNIEIERGQDIMLFGDFEDWDIDEEKRETSRWNTSASSRFICHTGSFSGDLGLCSTRKSTNKYDSVISFRNRIRVLNDALNSPNKNLSLFGYVKGTNAGPVNIIARYYASQGSTTFGEERAISLGEGTYEWQAFSNTLNMPSDNPNYPTDPTKNARAIRLFLRHSPQSSGKGMVAYDDISIINWESKQSFSESMAFVTPHSKDFIRVSAPMGRYTFTLVFESYAPR